MATKKKTEQTTVNLYKVTTSHEGIENFGAYYVLASNGSIAGSIINMRLNKGIKKTVLKSGKVNHPKEQVDEIERIASDVIVPEVLV